MSRGIRTLWLFALTREAEPLRRRFGLSSLSLEPTSLPGAASEHAIAIVGMGMDTAGQNLRQILARNPGITQVVSIGIAGGLAPTRRTGEVICPAEVIDETGRVYPCESPGHPVSGRLLSSRTLITDPAEKQALHDKYAAEIVDMEAAALAAVATEQGIAFSAIKAVSDPADRALPRELLQIAPDGTVHWWQLLRSLLARPRLMGELMAVDRDCRTARDQVCAAALQTISPE